MSLAWTVSCSVYVCGAGAIPTLCIMCEHVQAARAQLFVLRSADHEVVEGLLGGHDGVHLVRNYSSYYPCCLVGIICPKLHPVVGPPAVVSREVPHVVREVEEYWFYETMAGLRVGVGFRLMRSSLSEVVRRFLFSKLEMGPQCMSHHRAP